MPGNEAVQLSVSAEGSSGEELAGITDELLRWLKQTVPEGVGASRASSGPPAPGMKGAELPALATVAVVFFQSGAFRELMQALSTFIRERRREVCLTLTGANGEHIALSANNLKGADLHALAQDLAKLAKAAGLQRPKVKP
jgi:hypothetical protein